MKKVFFAIVVLGILFLSSIKFYANVSGPGDITDRPYNWWDPEEFECYDTGGDCIQMDPVFV